MKYDRTCSASGMFVANNVMRFNEIWRKSLYNFKQHVTLTIILLLLTTYTILPEPPQQSGRTLIVYCILCKYVIVVWV